jgi:hypothetical protein
VVPAAANVIDGTGNEKKADIKHFGNEKWCIIGNMVAANLLAVTAVGATVMITVINPIFWEYPFSKTLDVVCITWSLYQIIVAVRMYKHCIRFCYDVGTIKRRIEAIRMNRVREKLWDYHIVRIKIWSSTFKDVTRGIHV